ncbi:MAG: gliding motility protein GldL [Pseudarcicella sp.]|nr:gliding motility protein GldL [Pseudarcicella sp.]MBP6409567.1 gliding motility protein GldL [Pseudarcicella sp.]
MEKIINVIASFGAAIVIVGALFKILHWAGANQMLMVGMFTEAIIFIMFGVLYLSSKEEKHYDWERVYPELSKNYTGELPTSSRPAAVASSSNLGLTAKMDDMMANAKITPDIFDNLGKGFRSLTETVSKVTDISEATIATKEYTTNVKAASMELSDLNKSYNATISALTDMTNASTDAKEYRLQLHEATKKMGSLNAVYELELQDTNKHLQVMNSFYNGLTSTMSNISDAAKDSQQFKQELSKLTSNVQSLNNVYGSMLSAMKG